jgi:hypothetical protein
MTRPRGLEIQKTNYKTRLKVPSEKKKKKKLERGAKVKFEIKNLTTLIRTLLIKITWTNQYIWPIKSRC